MLKVNFEYLQNRLDECDTIRPVIKVSLEDKTVIAVITTDRTFKFEKFSWMDAYDYRMYSLDGKNYIFKNTIDERIPGNRIYNILKNFDFQKVINDVKKYSIVISNSLGQIAYVDKDPLTGNYSLSTMIHVFTKEDTKTFENHFQKERHHVFMKIPSYFVVLAGESLVSTVIPQI